MALKMATPYRHPKTGVYWFRKRVPNRIRDRIGASLFQRTLGTRDPVEAARRFRAMAVEIDELWPTLPLERSRLSTKKRMALAGEFYRWMVASHDDEPGPAGFWEGELEQDLPRFKPRGRPPSPVHFVRDHLPRFLEDRKIVLDELDVYDVAREVSKSIILAKETLAQHSKEDYRPHPEADRFPKFEPASFQRPAAQGAEFLSVRTDWEDFANEKRLSLGTRKRWRPLLLKLQDHVGSENLAQTTPEQIVDWKQKLLASGLDNATIGEASLASARSFFSWAVANKKTPRISDAGRSGRLRLDGMECARS